MLGDGPGSRNPIFRLHKHSAILRVQRAGPPHPQYSLSQAHSQAALAITRLPSKDTQYPARSTQ